jgi:hypothetical protein
LFHFLAQPAAACLGLRIQVGDSGHLDEFFFACLKRAIRIARPGFRLSLPALCCCIPLRTLRPLLPPRRLALFRLYGVCCLHPAPLGVIEC